MVNHFDAQTERAQCEAKYPKLVAHDSREQIQISQLESFPDRSKCMATKGAAQLEAIAAEVLDTFIKIRQSGARTDQDKVDQIQDQYAPFVKEVTDGLGESESSSLKDFFRLDSMNVRNDFRDGPYASSVMARAVNRPRISSYNEPDMYFWQRDAKVGDPYVIIRQGTGGGSLSSPHTTPRSFYFSFDVLVPGPKL